MHLTDEPASFLKHLQPADVLVFDSLSFEAGLVQWADRVPANHTSLVMDEQWLIEANRDPESGGSPRQPAVRKVRLSERLTDSGIVTISALRHPDVARDPALRQKVLERSVKDQEDTCFAYLDLVFLGPAAFVRSYRDELAEQGPVLAAALVVLDAAARAAMEQIPRDAWSLSCSEYVYRCFTEAAPGLELDIDPPLDLLPPAWMKPELWQQEQRRWQELREGNERGTCGDKFQRVADDPVADRVTPGDLLRSTSLTRVAVLEMPIHRAAPGT